MLDTVTDARLAALQTLFAGLQVRGGGLRGGSFSAEASFEGRLRLRGYAFVPGLRVSGSLASNAGSISGTVHVERDRERHSEDQPQRHRDRDARRASRPLPTGAAGGVCDVARGRRLAVAEDVRTAARAGRSVAALTR